MPIYRMATVEDVYALAELRWEFRLAEAGGRAAYSKEEFVNVCTEFFAAGLRQGNWTHWVADEDAILVACIGTNTVAKIPHPNRLQDRFGYVTNVYTRPAYRNQGVGSELMGRVIEWAREQDYEFLVLWPSERSTPFYERTGFSPAECLELEFRR